MIKKTYLCLFISLLFCLPGQAIVNQQGKLALQQLEGFKQRLHKKLSWVDIRIEKSLRKKTESLKQIEPLGQLRKEYLMRLDLYNRVALGIESYYQGGELKVFLSGYLLKISEIELKNNPQDSLWRAAVYISRALEKVPERFEDPLEFLAAYVDFSTLTQPKPPEDFVVTRNYTNGRDYEAGNPLPREKVGKQLPVLNTPIKIELKMQKSEKKTQ